MQPIRDTFADTRPPGMVIGHKNPDGIRRSGRDVEGVMAIDHGALRIRPLLHPGWGRAALAYGPFPRQPGLAFAVYMLNGHNTSQSGELTQSVLRRVGRWTLGSETDPLPKRLWAGCQNGRRQQFIRQLKRWYWLNRHYKNGQRPVLNENLAVGWFAEPSPANPLAAGNAFVMHALGANNGELWQQANGRSAPVLSGCQNVPIFYLVVLRQTGAAYYAASLPGVTGLGALPQMHPLGIDTHGSQSPLYAVVTQSVLGQIGFSVDSRVYSAEVTAVPTLAHWYGTAHAADPLTGTGDLHHSAAEIGGTWQVTRGTLTRTADGVQAQITDSDARLPTGQPVGLLHLLATAQGDAAALTVQWRVQDDANGWRLRLENGRCYVAVQQAGSWQSVATADAPAWLSGTAHALQILDDGQTMRFLLDGFPLLPPLVDARLAPATGIGLGLGGAITVRDVEAHPRTVPIPAGVTAPQPWLPVAARPVVQDNFTGAAGDLHERPLTAGRYSWQRTIGNGRFVVNGRCARVAASVQQPNPDRTAYTIPWPTPDYADLRLAQTPPGTARGQWEKGRGGLIFWQDNDNYLIVNTWLDDFYDGASVSSFFKWRGFDDLYDAVWTNVGARIFWGRPFRLRVVCDGLAYLVLVDDEPVLYRTLTDFYPQATRLTIRRVGIVANWEWGHDTGTLFTDFSAWTGRA